MTPTPRLSCADCDNKVRLVHLYPVGNPPSRSHPVNLAIEAQAAPPDALREAATDVLHAWDAGDIDRDFDRIMSAFDSLRAALVAPAGSVGHDDPGIVTANSDGTASVRPSVPAGSGHCIHGVNPDRDCARCGEGQS